MQGLEELERLHGGGQALGARREGRGAQLLREPKGVQPAEAMVILEQQLIPDREERVS